MNSNSQILCKPTEIWTLSSPFECVLHRNTSLSLYLLLCTFPKILSRGQNCLNIPGLQTLIEDSYLSHDSEKNCTKYLFPQNMALLKSFAVLLLFQVVFGQENCETTFVPPIGADCPTDQPGVSITYPDPEHCSR